MSAGTIWRSGCATHRWRPELCVVVGRNRDLLFRAGRVDTGNPCCRCALTHREHGQRHTAGPQQKQEQQRAEPESENLAPRSGDGPLWPITTGWRKVVTVVPRSAVRIPSGHDRPSGAASRSGAGQVTLPVSRGVTGLFITCLFRAARSLRQLSFDRFGGCPRGVLVSGRARGSGRRATVAVRRLSRRLRPTLDRFPRITRTPFFRRMVVDRVSVALRPLVRCFLTILLGHRAHPSVQWPLPTGNPAGASLRTVIAPRAVRAEVEERFLKKNGHFPGRYGPEQLPWKIASSALGTVTVRRWTALGRSVTRTLRCRGWSSPISDT